MSFKNVLPKLLINKMVGRGEWNVAERTTVMDISLMKEARVNPKVVLESSVEYLSQGIFFCP